MAGMVRFGDCVVDVATRTVARGGVERHLEPQAFDLLAYLVSHRDRVVPKSELLDEVWGDQFVSESALTTRIKEVRQALGDSGARQDVVKNFRGRGYRFVASIHVDSDGDARHPPVGRASSAAPTRLLGRDADIAGVVDLVEQSGLVTLVGPGGVGKTTLALEAAHRCGGDRADGVKVVHLAPVADPQSVVHALRRATGLVDVGDDENALVASIADLDALVVLDNCEHVLAETSRLVASVLRLDGCVRLLATSRERLAVPHERVWPVAPLADQPARLLLLDRSQSVAPDYRWSDDEEPAIARLLTTLDRLPLAIEMAAARLPSIGAVDLADLLGERLDLLRSSDRTADDRHRTVRALVAWSDDLLADDERDLLTALTAFAGAVGIDDIAAIVDADPAELAVGPLAGLVDKSLVATDTSQQSTRYRLLETVRAAAAPRRPESIDSRHAHHITGVVAEAAEALSTPAEPEAAARIDGLVAEIRVAHRWARTNAPTLAAELTAALLSYAQERQWTEPAAWARQEIELHAPDDPVGLAALAAIAAEASNRGDYELATEHAHRAAASDDHRIACSANDTLANLGLYTGDLDASRRHGQILLSLAEPTNDPVARVLGAASSVLALVYSGRVDEAVAALPLVEPDSFDSPTTTSWAAYARGEVLAASGRDAEALEQLDRAIELGASVGSHLVVSVAQVSALAVRARTGDVRDAVAAFGPLLAQYRRTRSLTHGITALRNVIQLLVRAGHDEPAMVLFGALSNPTVKSTYGSESALLDQARATVEERIGSAAVGAAIEHGSRHDVIWAIDDAIDTLADIARASA
jgi:predicted ATPase/DNA-binding winged helix-turn-helix (wHTH) protein